MSDPFVGFCALFRAHAPYGSRDDGMCTSIEARLVLDRVIGDQISMVGPDPNVGWKSLDNFTFLGVSLLSVAAYER